VAYHTHDQEGICQDEEAASHMDVAQGSTEALLLGCLCWPTLGASCCCCWVCGWQCKGLLRRPGAVELGQLDQGLRRHETGAGRGQVEGTVSKVAGMSAVYSMAGHACCMTASQHVTQS
jgi:hypothetical protein